MAKMGSQEYRDNMRQIAIKNNYGKWAKGKQLSERHKKKISDSLRGRMPKFIPDNSGISRTQEQKDKIRNSLLGRKIPQYVKEKISKNHSRHTLGKKFSIDLRKKLSIAHGGDGSLSPISRRPNLAYTEWRMLVYKRDNYKCRINNTECCGRIEAHHILNWASFPDSRYKIENGITLCKFHHPRKRSEEIRSVPIFNGLLNISN